MSLRDAVSDLLSEEAEASPQPPIKAHPQPGSEEPEAPCGVCGSVRWWQDRTGAWWCERCQPFEAGQWQRLVTLPEGERPAPPEPTPEEIQAAEGLAARYGWSPEALAEAFGSDWPGMAAEPAVLEALLRDVVPHPTIGTSPR